MNFYNINNPQILKNIALSLGYNKILMEQYLSPEQMNIIKEDNKHGFDPLDHWG